MPAAPSRPAPPERNVRRKRVDVRVKPGERLIMSPTDPTVTLNPLQSGIGTLTIEAAASAEVGDLRLGCAYELESDLEMTMQMTQGNRFAPPHRSARSWSAATSDSSACRSTCASAASCAGSSCTRSPRAASRSRGAARSSTTTFGGGRIEMPLDVLQGGDIAVLMSIYQVRGEFVLRAEMQTMFGDVREACRAYGFEKISWLDDRTPVE